MRISTDENDAAFREWMRGASTAAAPLIRGVLVDGHLVRDVVTADEEAGYIEKHVRFPDGQLAIDPETRQVARERVYGHVRIDWTDAGRKMVQYDEEQRRRALR